MNKEELVTVIRNAKAGHKRWVENALSLIEGLPLDKNQVPVNATDCVFGKWYYGEGQGLKSLPSYREVEQYHDALHKTYREIFMLLFGEDKAETSLFSRLFGTSQKSSEEKRKLAKDKYLILRQQSKIIMKKLDDLEAMIITMNQEQIDGYIKIT